MGSVLIALLSFFGFIIAYHTYGRYLSRKVFNLRLDAVVPSEECNDGVDFVPTRRHIVFGHHFTSIAGTGPIVGPAIAIYWGWLPALLWVLFGSIFIGAVHDFGALVVSLRSRGQTLGDVAGRMLNSRVRLLFLSILFFALMIVIAVFGLVIAFIFSQYPQSVLSVWIAMPMAIVIGLWLHRSGAPIFLPSLIALSVLYLAVYIGVEFLPISFGDLPLFAGADASLIESLGSSVVLWTLILLVYCFIASVLPVWVLLQPRDYINSLQLFVALILLVVGLLIARPDMVAPAIQSAPGDAPPIFPFLFITIACGAISGFHCLVSSGTTSKQLKNETDAQFVGYGAMLLEGGLAVVVILACAAGLGMGVLGGEGNIITGHEAWAQYYSGSWADMTLARTVAAFVEGGANMIAVIGFPLDIAAGIIAVMVACFAATTLDTATRLQRYVIQELGATLKVTAFCNKYIATLVAVATGGTMAMIAGPNGPGSGGMLLWPLFGATNQILAGLAFLVVAFYLLRHNKPVWFLIVPLLIMVVTPGWALIYQLSSFYTDNKWLLFTIGLLVFSLQIWIVIEGLVLIRKIRGVLPTPLPPLRIINTDEVTNQPVNN